MKYERVFMINESGWSNGTRGGFCPWPCSQGSMAANRVRLWTYWNLQSSAKAGVTASKSGVA